MECNLSSIIFPKTCEVTMKENKISNPSKFGVGVKFKFLEVTKPGPLEKLAKDHVWQCVPNQVAQTIPDPIHLRTVCWTSGIVRSYRGSCLRSNLITAPPFILTTSPIGSVPAKSAKYTCPFRQTALCKASRRTDSNHAEMETSSLTGRGPAVDFWVAPGWPILDKGRLPAACLCGGWLPTARLLGGWLPAARLCGGRTRFCFTPNMLGLAPLAPFSGEAGFDWGACQGVGLP